MDKSKFNDKNEWRKFGIGLAIILAVIATVQLIIGRDLYLYFYIAGVLSLTIGLAIPILLKPIFILFSYIGFVLGWFMTRVILSILFYLIFTIIGVASKLFNKTFLDIMFSLSAFSPASSNPCSQFWRPLYRSQFAEPVPRLDYEKLPNHIRLLDRKPLKEQTR